MTRFEELRMECPRCDGFKYILTWLLPFIKKCPRCKGEGKVIV